MNSCSFETLLSIAMNFILFIISLSVISSGHSFHRFTKNKKVILILADGVRYDYVQDKSLKGFARLAKNGVKAQYVQPIFPANSYPNWYTIVTGLYAESNGMVQNFMYDAKKKDTFLMFPHANASHVHWWNQSEPLWVTSEKQGIKTAVYWWDGCQVPIRGVTPTYCEEYQSYWTWPYVKEDTMEAINEIIDNFKANEWQLALLYYEAVDSTGHAFGTDSTERKEALKDLDEILTKVQNEIEANRLEQEVILYVVSDHGMVNVNPGNKGDTTLIDIESIVKPEDVFVMLDRGSTSFLYPKPGKEEKVLQDLKKAGVKGLRFYKKQDIPVEYHIRENDRTAPILLVAEKGYFLRGFPNSGKTKPVWDVIYKGHHGYDPYATEEMRTIMFARGPGLKKNFTSRPLLMTDHYNLLCHLLDIEAQPNNGSWARVRGFLSLYSNSASNTVLSFSLLTLLLCLILILILINKNFS